MLNSRGYSQRDWKSPVGGRHSARAGAAHFFACVLPLFLIGCIRVTARILLLLLTVCVWLIQTMLYTLSALALGRCCYSRYHRCGWGLGPRRGHHRHYHHGHRRHF